MKILIIADPHIPVPPINYGGAERIIAAYARQLSKLGHSIKLLAGVGSYIPNIETLIHKPPTLSRVSRAYRKLSFQVQSFAAARDCDLVFNHGRFDYLELLLKIGIPIVHMAHNPLDPKQIEFMEARVSNPFALYGISNFQLSQATTKLPSFVIHNFVETNKYTPSTAGSGYLAFLGRLTENKGIHTAIQVSLRTGLPLKIAGPVPTNASDLDFFRKNVEPFLNNNNISYVGPVNDEQKQKFLSGADVLLFPTQWPEPCAVVVSESLACGTPVVAFSTASNAEIITPGLTGFLCPNIGNIDQMSIATNEALKLSRKRCREEAVRRFDVKVATDSLLFNLSSLNIV